MQFSIHLNEHIVILWCLWHLSSNQCGKIYSHLFGDFAIHCDHATEYSQFINKNYLVKKGLRDFLSLLLLTFTAGYHLLLALELSQPEPCLA